MAPKRQPIKHGTIYAYKARGFRYIQEVAPE